MLKIGITGGIGSGKTIIAHVFEILGVPVFYSDAVAKNLLSQDKNVKHQIINIFGEALLSDKNEIDKNLLSKIVFSDKEKLAKLNSIIHPEVKKVFENWLKEQTKTNTKYILKEAALLFEAGTYKELDKIITVIAPKDLRIKWVMKRDNITAEAIIKRMENQWTDDEKIKLSDFIIQNDDKTLLLPQILKIHNKLLKY